MTDALELVRLLRRARRAVVTIDPELADELRDAAEQIAPWVRYSSMGETGAPVWERGISGPDA